MKKKWAVVFLVVVCGVSGLIYEHHDQGSPSAPLETASTMTADEPVEGQSLLCVMMNTLLFSSPRPLFESENEAITTTWEVLSARKRALVAAFRNDVARACVPDFRLIGFYSRGKTCEVTGMLPVLRPITNTGPPQNPSYLLPISKEKILHDQALALDYIDVREGQERLYMNMALPAGYVVGACRQDMASPQCIFDMYSRQGNKFMQVNFAARDLANWKRHFEAVERQVTCVDIKEN
ncbi:hypothetical protein G7007_07945 [Pseudomonas entomophila]|uniref:hypothetical protein n=1 Tax=Pseudomonas entomophila TaxID=312306 RepID=UPI0015E354F1|nr:hypothetical protein [Pseudomonas entomophila]MBA1192790.1 hypothetical protein [Pseudomonas entomophila]